MVQGSRNFQDDEMFDENLEEEEDCQIMGGRASASRDVEGAEIQGKNEDPEESNDGMFDLHVSAFLHSTHL